MAITTFVKDDSHISSYQNGHSIYYYFNQTSMTVAILRVYCAWCNISTLNFYRKVERILISR